MDTPKLALSIKEVAEALGLAPSTIKAMLDSGQLRGVRVGRGKGKFLIPRKAVEDLLSGVAS